MDRRQRAARIVVVFAALLAATAVAVLVLSLEPLHGPGLRWIGFVLLLMIGVLIWDAKKSLPELEGERMVLESSSRFRHVIEYGLIALGTGLAFAGDALVRRFGIEPPWRFGWGTIFFVALPAVMLGFYFLVPRICAWIGIGTRVSRTPSDSSR